MKQLFGGIFGLLIVVSCGGALGSIETYTIDGVSSIDVKENIDQILDENPGYGVFDTNIYVVRKSTIVDGFYYVVLSENSEKYILKYAIGEDSELKPTIILVSGARYGSGIKLAKNLSYSDRHLFEHIFRRDIIEKIEHKKTE